MPNKSWASKIARGLRGGQLVPGPLLAPLTKPMPAGLCRKVNPIVIVHSCSSKFWDSIEIETADFPFKIFVIGLGCYRPNFSS